MRPSDWVWEHSELTGNEWKVHLAMADLANEGHEYLVWASEAWLATRCRVSVRTVKRAIRAMLERGYLEDRGRCPRGGQVGVQTYRFVLPGAVDKLSNVWTSCPTSGQVVHETGQVVHAHGGDTALLDKPKTNSYAQPDAQQELRTREMPPQEVEVRFDEFWATYPRRKDRLRALACWRARIREGVSPDDLIAAATAYANECAARGTRPEFIKHGATFIGSNGSWSEYLEAASTNDALQEEYEAYVDWDMNRKRDREGWTDRSGKWNSGSPELRGHMRQRDAEGWPIRPDGTRYTINERGEHVRPMPGLS